MTQEPPRKPGGTGIPSAQEKYPNTTQVTRPVSLTWIIGKIQEHIVVSRILSHLEEHSDNESWLAWVPQATIYRDPTHTSCTWLGEHNQWQRPNWCLIHRLYQGLWHSAPQTPADEAEKLCYRRQDEHLDCRITTRLPTESDDQWNWIHLVPCPLGCPTGYSDRPDIVSSLHQRHCIKSRMRFFVDDSIIYPELHDNNNHTLLQEDISKLQSWSERWQMVFKIENCFVLTILVHNHKGKVYV